MGKSKGTINRVRILKDGSVEVIEEIVITPQEGEVIDGNNSEDKEKEELVKTKKTSKASRKSKKS